MEQQIRDVLEIVKDYRAGENPITEASIKTWIEQFNPDDQIFVLEEMRNILEKRYISKAKAKELVEEMITFLAGKLEFADPKEFLLASSFIDNQHDGKSQKILLQFVDEIIQDKYGIGIADCAPEKPLFYIYVDDVLCTGDTLVKNLTRKAEADKGWFNKIAANGKTNFDNFRDDGAKLVLSYFAIHQPSVKNARGRIYHEMGRQNVDFIYAWDTQYAIDKSIATDSKMNFIFPKEDLDNQDVVDCKQQIETKIQNAGYRKGETIQYRAANKPDHEDLFTSPENRDRFEKIILDKCVEIYNSSEHLRNDLRPRPLGYGLYTDLSLGYGTLIFTWRNVPYNVPLVFWYSSQHWAPLFERNHT